MTDCSNPKLWIRMTSTPTPSARRARTCTTAVFIPRWWERSSFSNHSLLVAGAPDWSDANMVNPFDLRTILVAKHAQHIVLIHFPIALFITGVGFDLLSRGKRDSRLASAAYLNLCLAAATVLPAVMTGLLAWQFALDGKRLKGLLLLHVVAASIAALLVITSWWLHWRTRRTEPV